MEQQPLTVETLVKRFLAIKKVSHPERFENARYAWETRMKDKFGATRADELTGRHTLDYINWAIGVEREGWTPLLRPLAPATANKDIAVLQGAYTHARKYDQFPYRPNFAVHDVSGNIREGFLEQEEFDRIIAVIREMGPDYLWLQSFITMAYECGNRRGELQSLKVSQFNQRERIVRLNGRDTKSGKPRELGVSSELYPLLMVMAEGKKGSDYLFTRRRLYPFGAAQRTDEQQMPIGDFRKLWRRILRQAGIERHVLLHDFRRSLVNNMIQAGIDRDVIRQYTGHSVAGMDRMLSRYHIVRRRDIMDAALKNEERKLRMREQTAEASMV